MPRHFLITVSQTQHVDRIPSPVSGGVGLADESRVEISGYSAAQSPLGRIDASSGSCIVTQRIQNRNPRYLLLSIRHDQRESNPARLAFEYEQPMNGESGGKESPLVSVLVPVKDEEESLKQLIAETADALTPESDVERARHWELIFIDDGSVDDSWQAVIDLSQAHDNVGGIRLRRNFGKSEALSAGLSIARGEIIVTMDGDLQDDPAELPRMIDQIDESVDLVVGHKAERRDPLSKRWASRVFNFVTSIVTGLRLRDHNCGLKVGKRAVFERVPLYGEMHRFIAAIAHAQGFRVVEQPVNHRPRQFGFSKFGIERYARGGLDLLTVVTLTRYNRRPAHLFGGIGIIVGLIGGALLIYLTALWLFTDQSIGNRPLLLLGVLLVLLAVQLVSLGVLAELIVSQRVQREDRDRNVIEHIRPSSRTGGG